MSHLIDKIIYINLDKRTDRKAEIEQELQHNNLRFERFPAIQTPEGCIGCSLSHLQVVKLAKERGYNNILILEDDFMFLSSDSGPPTQKHRFSKGPFYTRLSAICTHSRREILFNVII